MVGAKHCQSIQVNQSLGAMLRPYFVMAVPNAIALLAFPGGDWSARTRPKIEPQWSSDLNQHSQIKPCKTKTKSGFTTLIGQGR